MFHRFAQRKTDDLRAGDLVQTLCLACLLIVGLLVAPAPADEPLNVRIDQCIAAKVAAPLAPAADDAEFARRLYLDLAGRIPTVQEIRTFLADAAPDKRTRLIDALLASADYPRRMQECFSVMLLERRTGTDIATAAWEDYLRRSFVENKPWNRLVQEILAADSPDPALQPAMKFYLDRGLGAYDQITRDVGRLFLGRDLQCAQCHDHPQVDDYKQVHYHGLLAFLNRTFLYRDGQTQQILLAEKAEGGKLEFQSVFLPDQKQATGPRLLNGAELEIPTFAAGQEFEAPAEGGRPGVPKFRPRLQLAAALTAPENGAFAHNAVNRLWFILLGHGLVHPLDLHHAGNPPSHPELLELLSAEFVRNGYDIKAFLRELALSQTYQRSSRLPEGQEVAPPESYVAANLKRLSAEQLYWSFLTATGEPAPANPDEVRARFVAAFANPPGEPEVEFSPSLAAALFLSNDGLVVGGLAPKPGNLLERLLALTDPPAVADELYLSVLSRPATDEERAEVADCLAKAADQRQTALAELVWALLASTEFCVNH